jgi:sugar O-acyltransferase (sialic acid O-acetyltransferase NeuD family)
MRKVIFWGASGQAKVLHEALAGSDLKLVALVDNRDVPSPLPGIPVMRGEAGLKDWLRHHRTDGELHCCVAIGGAHGRDRLQIMDLLKELGLLPVTIVHRAAFVANDASLGEGCQVLAHAAVCTHARLGRGVIVNTSASVDHDCILANGVHLAPGAHLAGEVSVSENTLIGVGAVVLPRVRIGRDVVVGAGSVVLRDIPSGVTVAGNPARILEPKRK